MTSKISIDNRKLLQKISTGEAAAGIDFGNAIVRELAAFRLSAMGGEPHTDDELSNLLWYSQEATCHSDPNYYCEFQRLATPGLIAGIIRELQERLQADSEPVAEVVSVFGDSEIIGERELKLLVGIQNMPYGTKFYRHAQPAKGLELAGWQFKSVNGDWLGLIDEHGKNQAVREGCEVREVFAMADGVNDRDQVRREHAEWSQTTFGNVGPIGPLKHLSKEALEAVAEPDDLSEWADMQFLLWDAQRRAGITDEQITLAMIEKLAVNKQREWPEPKDGEPRLHIKEQPAPVVQENSDPRDAFEAAFPMPKHAQRCGDGYAVTSYGAWTAYEFVKKWEGWNACRSAMLQGRQKSAGASNNGRSGENVQDLLAGNCRENGNSSTNNCREIAETSTNRSREHFISLCNEFWNWSEMDLVCAEDRGYELRMEWDVKVFKHPVTQALWRMYQAAPTGIQMFPDGYVMVPKEPTKEMIDAGWLYFMGAKNPSSKGAYKAMLAAAPQEVKGEHQIRDEMDMGARITSHRFKV